MERSKTTKTYIPIHQYLLNPETLLNIMQKIIFQEVL